MSPRIHLPSFSRMLDKPKHVYVSFLEWQCGWTCRCRYTHQLFVVAWECETGQVGCCDSLLDDTSAFVQLSKTSDSPQPVCWRQSTADSESSRSLWIMAVFLASFVIMHAWTGLLDFYVSVPLTSDNHEWVCPIEQLSPQRLDELSLEGKDGQSKYRAIFGCSARSTH
jgi:hypothetical protein